MVLVGISQITYEKLVTDAELTSVFAEAVIVDAGLVSSMPAKPGLGVLVLIGSLNDHGLIRGINAQLRTRASQGCVTYLSAFTFADSKKNLSDLEMFLTYGEHGKETFTFKTAESLFLPWRTSERNSWDDERALLQQIKSESELVPELETRLVALESAGALDNTLFLPGKDGKALAIAPDFVYLDTKADREKISQADIFLVVANLLAVARSGGLLNGLPQAQHAWAQSVYGQVLVELPTICPRNLRDYNDAVLRACFIRAASKQELNYAVDEECSSEVVDVLLAELAAWSDGRGDSLPEILLALATRRLQLTSFDEDKLMSKLTSTELPGHLIQLRDAWVNRRS